MKLFYDEHGTVVGSVVGATKEIEDGIHQEGASEITVPQELAIELLDPTQLLDAHDLVVIDNEIETTSP